MRCGMASLPKLFFWVCCSGLTFLVMMFVGRDGRALFSSREFDHRILDHLPHDGRPGFQIDTIGCQIPEFDPYDETIRGLYYQMGKLNCHGVPPLVYRNRTHLTVNLTAFYKHYGKGELPTCQYKSIWRYDDGKSDDKYKMESHGHRFNGSVKVDDEFFYIECRSGDTGTLLFRDYQPFIQIKSKVEKEAGMNYEDWVKATEKTVKERLSVVFVGVDSISRLNMLRHMRRTYDYLRNTMDAIDLHGFNKVADNTFLNVVPLLAGKYVEECWNETMKKKPLDYLSLAWKDFEKRGYRTLFAEDAPEIATFNYLKAGFFHQPTHYYLRPFNLATENSLMRKHGVNAHCFNERPEATVVMDWLADFMATFKQKPIFGYVFNSRLTHDNLNYAGYADKIYLDFIQSVHRRGLLNNTVLIFFSDHGIRFGKIRETYIGKIEERMPYFIIAFPSWFSAKYPQIWKNLRQNERRLTTPFDIYETLRDLLHFGAEVRSVNSSSMPRGLSLFSEIPEERTCVEATILPHWCTCSVKKAVSTTSEKVQEAALNIISLINEKLKEQTEICAKLELLHVLDARVSGISDQVLRFLSSHKDVIGRYVSFGHRANAISDYLLTISVSPSGGVFESTVRYFEDDGKFQVMGDISRINMYGNQSYCVTEPSLRKFCYCVDNSQTS